MKVYKTWFPEQVIDAMHRLDMQQRSWNETDLAREAKCTVSEARMVMENFD